MGKNKNLDEIAKEITHSANINQEKYMKFLRHECEYGKSENQTAIGGRFTYCYTPTGIGTTVKVKCLCGLKKNITLYSGSKKNCLDD